MIPTREQLDGIAERSAGDLSEWPFAVVLCALAVHERTAILQIGRRQLEKKIVLERGVPVGCSSNLVHETLGRFMVAQGRLEEGQYQECLGLSAARGIRFGEVLVEREIVNSYELFRILQQNLAKKLLDGFAWQDGQYHVLTGAAEVDSPLKVKVPQLVVTGIGRFAPQAQVNSSVGAWVGQRLELHPEPFFPLEELRLSASQKKILAAMEKGGRIDELAQASGVPFDELTRFLYSLAVIRGVAPESEIPRGSKRAATPRPVAESARAPEKGRMRPPVAASAAEVAKIRNELMQAYLEHRSQEPFELLGLEVEGFSVARLEAGFLDFAARFGPWRFESEELVSLTEKARDLFLAGARAFGELADPEKRNSLIYRRQTLLKEPRTPSASRSVIKTDLLDSELQFKKGQKLLENDRVKEALQLLEFASDCDPQNALYRAELAWARYLFEPNTAGPRSLEALEEARRIDPASGTAVYYTGEILRRMGQLDQAEPFLRKACKLTTDRRATESLKELVLANKKRRR